jgi:hypothetical protein
LKQTITFLFALFFLTQGISQFSIGGQASYLSLTGSSDLSNIGIGLRAEKVFDEKTVIQGGANYFLSSTFSDNAVATAFSSSTEPSQIDLDLQYELSFIYIYVGGKRYLVGGNDQSFSLYVDAEAGLLMAPSTTILGQYDESLYQTFIKDGDKETLANWTIGGGVGIEKAVGFGYLYTSAKIILPATESNGVTISYEIPTSYMITAGLRIPFGS